MFCVKVAKTFSSRLPYNLTASENGKEETVTRAMVGGVVLRGARGGVYGSHEGLIQPQPRRGITGVRADDERKLPLFHFIIRHKNCK